MAVLSGVRASAYVGDLYNRIHLLESEIDFGFVAESRTSEARLWNAYLEPQLLTSVAEPGGEGVHHSPDVMAPRIVFPLEVWSSGVIATLAGADALINAKLSWFFGNGDAVELSVYGRRVMIWNSSPNWNEFVTEKLEWLTDVLSSQYGLEQRRQIRIGPRKEYEFSFLVDNRNRRVLENKIVGWGLRPYLVPCWEQVHESQEGYSAGTSTIILRTEARCFKSDGAVVLMNGQSFEIAKVGSVNTDSVVLDAELQRDWPPGTRVYPALEMIMEGTPEVSRITDTGSVGSVRFRSVHSVDLENLFTDEYDLFEYYKEFPVLKKRPSESSDPQTGFPRDMLLLESGSGLDFIDDLADFSKITQTHRWMLQEERDIIEFRALLYELRGKLKSLWVPTFRQDFLVVAPCGYGDSTLLVENSGFSGVAEGKEGRKHLRIETIGPNAEVFYREIVGVDYVDEDTERLHLDESIYGEFQPEEFLLISFMMNARLQTDRVEIAWHSTELMESEVTFKLVIPVLDYEGGEA